MILNDVKIISNGLYSDVYVNGIQMRELTKIKVDLENQPHRVTLEMLGKVEIDAKAGVSHGRVVYLNNQEIKTNSETYLNIDGDKYKLVKIEGGEQ